ncbi:MAG: hypothetical protein M9927_21415 [Anaerolineae bacterium]|nr:hypothetical protein [Anaerolineae bacterium]
MRASQAEDQARLMWRSCAVREHWPVLALQVDANSAYTLADATAAGTDAFDLLLIEQPLHHDDMVDHAVLQKQLRTPVCLDESIHSFEHARWALDIHACRVINIKVGRVGGLHRGAADSRFVRRAWRAGLVRRHAGDQRRARRTTWRWLRCPTSPCR